MTSQKSSLGEGDTERSVTPSSEPITSSDQQTQSHVAAPDALDDANFVPMGARFRGFLPVVIDLETGGFDKDNDALLEMAAVTLRLDHNGMLSRDQTHSWHIEPFEGANIDPKSLEVNGIDPYNAFRKQIATAEPEAMRACFQMVRQAIKANSCKRAILVGHNANFDVGFLHAAAARNNIKRNPFHPFSCFDTVTLAAMAYGQTVLARACKKAGFDWDGNQAHSAVYDTEQTADLFCQVMNDWQLAYPKNFNASADDSD